MYMSDLKYKIFNMDSESAFNEVALEVFRFQALHCAPYRDYLQLIGVSPDKVLKVDDIPFLPIELFKTHKVYCGKNEPEMVFSSSSTTGMIPSKHYVADIAIYEESFVRGFELFYGKPSDMAIFALLPNYLEREGSSLVYMFDRLIDMSAGGGFYLHDLDKLVHDMENCPYPKILLGVTYALLDLAELYPIKLNDTIVMETGGMKGRRKELPKEELHSQLCKAFGVDAIHSEYGMAELLSQGYSSGSGIFRTPPWMKIVIRDINDPFSIMASGVTEGINVIDLANIYSCSFIQTQDMGARYDSGEFKIFGRITGSEIRGCNLLVQ